MAKLIVMCGLQCSGKSTKAKELKETLDAVLLSSDEIRKEHPEWNNDTVFKTLYADMNDYLKDGRNVIIDATNITMKSRRQIFNNLKEDCTKICYIMNTDFSTCLSRLNKRNEDKDQHYVPEEVLFKYRKSFEIPFYEEGWDIIVIDEIEQFSSKDYEKTLNVMNDFDQHNSHHKYSLGKHCWLLEEYLKDYGFPKGTGIFHDIGKLYTQSFGEDGQAHYYEHHNVGAYYLLTHTSLIEEEVLDLLFYVNYHMLPFNIKTNKAKDRWKERFGEEKFNNLLILNQGDRKASGTE